VETVALNGEALGPRLAHGRCHSPL
jgi:hypothetical protein